MKQFGFEILHLYEIKNISHAILYLSSTAFKQIFRNVVLNVALISGN